MKLSNRKEERLKVWQAKQRLPSLIADLDITKADVAAFAQFFKL